MKLLDTDTCVELLRGNEAVIDRRVQVSEEVVTSWITAAELYFGAAKSTASDENRLLVTEFLTTLRVVGIDRASAQAFGKVKALLERAGGGLADADLLIGAIGLAHGAAVVTGNTRHMRRIPGLAIESWVPVEPHGPLRSRRARR